MSEITLGRLITDPNAMRDAVHIALTPVIAVGNDIRPGCLLRFEFGSKTRVLCADFYHEEEAVGIADPFLVTRPRPRIYSYGENENEQPERVRNGDRIWMMLFPGSVTGMRHHFQHPALDAPSPTFSEAELWLRRFAERWGFRYDEMINIATHPDGEDFGGYIVAHGRDVHGQDDLGDDLELFWSNIEALNGTRYETAHRERVGWSCTC